MKKGKVFGKGQIAVGVRPHHGAGPAAPHGGDGKVKILACPLDFSDYIVAI